MPLPEQCFDRFLGQVTMPGADIDYQRVRTCSRNRLAQTLVERPSNQMFNFRAVWQR